MQNLLKSLRIVVPVGFILGASMELFMIYTGFYTIVTRKAAERKLEYQMEQERQVKRMHELNVPINIQEYDNSKATDRRNN